MVGRSLDEGEPFGIVLRDDDGARSIGCTARVDDVLERFEDGRMNIVVSGEEPFKVLDRFEAAEYPAGEVEVIDERGSRAATRTRPRPPARRSPSWPSARRASAPRRSSSRTPPPTRSRPGSSCPPRPSRSCWRPATRTSGWSCSRARSRPSRRRWSAPRRPPSTRARTARWTSGNRPGRAPSGRPICARMDPMRERTLGASGHLRRGVLAATSVASVLSLTLGAAMARGAAGDLDTSFGSGGKLATSFTAGVDGANDMAIQADGKIVVVGYQDLGGGFAVARYNTDGSLDTNTDSTPGTNFGDDGVAAIVHHHRRRLRRGARGRDPAGRPEDRGRRVRLQRRSARQRVRGLRARPLRARRRPRPALRKRRRDRGDPVHRRAGRLQPSTWTGPRPWRFRATATSSPPATGTRSRTGSSRTSPSRDTTRTASSTAASAATGG